MMKMIPYFEVPSVDSLDALMSFDREKARTYKIFSRALLEVEVAQLKRMGELERPPANTVVVVLEIAEDCRVRTGVSIVWGGHPDGQRRAIFLPDDWLDDHPMIQRALKIQAVEP